MKTALIIGIFITVIFFVSWIRRQSQVGSGGFQKISPLEVIKRLNDGEKGLIIDVRTPEEYAEKHIPKSLLIPLDRIEQESAQKIPDKESPLYLYCLTGRRSANGAQILVNLGYRNVYNMGGMSNWPGKLEGK